MRKKNPKVSVIIPVYNGSGTLRKTLQTVRSQGDFDTELIVVDDASTEDITGMVRELGGRLIRLSENSGPAVARTRGAEAASGEILLFTDSDVWLPEGLIRRLRNDFEENNCQCVQGTFSEHCPHTNFFSQYKNLYNRFVLRLLGRWITTTYTSVTAVKKDFFFECGGFDRNIRTASVEDRTLGENIVRAGGRILLDPTIEVVHNKRLTALGFYRNQFRRSRDLAKLMLRQKETGFLEKTGSFGTTSQSAMNRLPAVFGLTCLMVPVPWNTWFLLPAAGLGAWYLSLTWKWIRYLVTKRGIGFALRGQLVDFTDALVSGCGVIAGALEYKILGKRY